jgi:hypothetical protein
LSPKHQGENAHHRSRDRTMKKIAHLKSPRSRQNTLEAKLSASDQNICDAKAAYQGDPRAAMLLGQMYRVGIGMTADPTQAYAWSEVATLEGSAFAKRERDASFRDLSADDQKAAIARAREILKTVKSETTSLPKPPESK